ncbi:MAG: type III-A CRISPR-associated protein Cas10/Csm1 [Acidobacteriota bacterium]
MDDRKLTDASCRMALAALMHDLGKFAERARIEEAEEKDAKGITRRDINAQLYCPHFDGRPTHIHAAYTGIALDLLERHCPELVGHDMAPFAPWKDKDADDSLINAAAKHHKPETFLQWVIATADRVASGFEREEFEKYNASVDETPQKTNHYSARQITLFEQIRLNGNVGDIPLAWRYPLNPLCPASIFPVRAEDCEVNEKAAAQREYRGLWLQFLAALDDIPQSHRAHLALWLDHFESLWQCFTQAIPAATAFNVKPEVSLYDHSKTTAALAVALWRYHYDQAHNAEEVRKKMEERADWSESKLLLVQGDFSGIQDFIFASGGETQRRAAKLLRGRSFYVSLLTECAALRVLDELSLPPTSQVVNAAGKFLIVAPNTDRARAALTRVQAELDRWFLAHTCGQSGIGLAWLPASCDDFLHGQGGESPFRKLMKRLFEQLEEVKLKRFGLCNESAPNLFANFLDAFDSAKGECKIDGRSPATEALDEKREIWVSALARDQIRTGEWLAQHERILVTRNSLDHNSLKLSLFGYWVNFTGDEDISGKFGREVASGNLQRVWDFSLPESADRPLWSGYARRNINAYVPRFEEANAWDAEKYRDVDDIEESERRPNAIKTLNHLAVDDRRLVTAADGIERWVGVKALMTLKGDVDNLGLIFQKGMERPTFAKMAALSRQMNAFFAIWLPWLCRTEFKNTYTVFAGGDDFFLIGPWHSTIRLARRMKEHFGHYVAHNCEIHFSAGLSMTKPGLPIRHLGRLAEEALDYAKTCNPERLKPPPKNSVTCYDISVTWKKFEELMERQAALEQLAGELQMSTGYLYALLSYTDMAGKEKKRPENALWHSHFAYRTRRMLEARIKGGDDPKSVQERRLRLQAALADEIAHKGIGRFGESYKIALFNYLYQQRD